MGCGARKSLSGPTLYYGPRTDNETQRRRPAATCLVPPVDQEPWEGPCPEQPSEQVPERRDYTRIKHVMSYIGG